MKKRLVRKCLIVETIAVALLMVSIATAVPQVYSKPIKNVVNDIEQNEAPTQQAAGYLPTGIIDVVSVCFPTLQAAGYLNENEIFFVKELEDLLKNPLDFPLLEFLKLLFAALASIFAAFGAIIALILWWLNQEQPTQ